VIWREGRRNTVRDFRRQRRFTCDIDRLAADRTRGTKFGVVRAGIERRAFGIAVEVDDIPRMGCAKERGALGLGEFLEAIDMPIGIGDRLRDRGQP
jgi:hypothetical protein